MPDPMSTRLANTPPMASSLRVDICFSLSFPLIVRFVFGSLLTRSEVASAPSFIDLLLSSSYSRAEGMSDWSAFHRSKVGYKADNDNPCEYRYNHGSLSMRRLYHRINAVYSRPLIRANGRVVGSNSPFGLPARAAPPPAPPGAGSNRKSSRLVVLLMGLSRCVPTLIECGHHPRSSRGSVSSVS